jgi:hypothetical protein
VRTSARRYAGTLSGAMNMTGASSARWEWRAGRLFLHGLDGWCSSSSRAVTAWPLSAGWRSM